MSLVVERLHQRLHAARPLAPARIAEWNEAFASLDADDLTDGLASRDQWLLIRRLSLKLRWHTDAAGPAVALQCRDALRAALARALADGRSDDIVRYDGHRDALADLLYRSALGDRSRHWAWHRMALVAREDASPSEALAQGLARLLREPGAIWPVIDRLMHGEPAAASLTAVLHAIPAHDWLALLHATPRARGHVLALGGAGRDDDTAALPETALPYDPAWHALVAWAAARPALVERQRDTLTVLLATAWLDGSAASPAECRAHVVAVRRALSPRDRDPRATPAAPRERHVPPATDVRTPVTRPDDLPPLPALPDNASWASTAWGGALFWLPRAGADALLEDGEDPADAAPLALRLRAVGEALGVPPDDPALRAFCGGELPVAAPPDALRARARAQVEAWTRWLDAAAPDLPAPRLAAVCCRAGRLRFEPGWIELHLPVESVDVRVRRLGLDLDPGWLPWLGCVLKVCYDD